MSDAHEHKSELTYTQVFIALIVLTVLTVGASLIPFPRTVSLVVALGIAGLKASLVALYFMHLRFAVKPIYVTVGFPLMLMIIAVMALMPDVAINPDNARITIEQAKASEPHHEESAEH